MVSLSPHTHAREEARARDPHYYTHLMLIRTLSLPLRAALGVTLILWKFESELAGHRCLLKALPSPWWACSAREPTLPEASGLRAPLCSRRSLQCHSRLHVVTGLARSDFVPPHSHVHLQNGRQQDGQCGLFAAVGNRRCEWHRSYEAPAAQAATRQATPAGIPAGETLRRLLAAPCSGCSANGFGMRLLTYVT